MTDIFLKDFYKNVKDTSWPEIDNYSDFLKLPSYIQEECVNLHKVNSRLDEIESPDHWRDLLSTVYRFENLAYLPVYKCASTHYIDLFHNQLEWTECRFSDLEPGTICFGLFQEPTVRYLKGITEWVWRHLMPHVNYELDRVPVSVLKTILVGDVHSLPYTITLKSILDKINCIPMGEQSDSQIKQSLTNLFKSQKHNITIPTNNSRTYESSELKLQLYNAVKENFKNSIGGDLHEFNGRAEYTYLLLSADLKFYHNLITSFDPHWQQVKTI